MQTLSEDTISRALETLPEWTLEDGELHWRRRFLDFSRTFAFLARVALLAEKRDHHPDVTLAYDRLELRLVSHDVGGVTQRDLEMAAAITELGPA